VGFLIALGEAGGCWGCWFWNDNGEGDAAFCVFVNRGFAGIAVLFLGYEIKTSQKATNSGAWAVEPISQSIESQVEQQNSHVHLGRVWCWECRIFGI
jgi:hypothetical protein